MEELKEEIDKLLKGLRSCDSQATAVKWMTRAYKAMEQCLPYLEPPKQSMFYIPERPRLEIVQEVPKFPLAPVVPQYHPRQLELQARSANQTVVYPEVFRHPGLKPLPRAWTREDTRRLERAAQARQKPLIQRLGK